MSAKNPHRFFLVLLLTIALLTSCSHNNLPTEGLAVIDVSKKYPEKEILLNDIADISYVHLDAKHNDFLYKGSIRYVTENTFVVNDALSHSILFFSKDGSPKSRFCRYGNGPEEYLGMCNEIVYDEAIDDVFINTPHLRCIQVYSSKGEYKRKLPLPHGVRVFQMGCFDSQSLIVFDESRMLYKAQPKTPEDNMDYLTHLIDSSFFLISKADGQVMYIPMSASQNDLSFKTSKGNPMLIYSTYIVKHVDGFLLYNPEIDTVFLFNKNKELSPVIYKIPSVEKSEPKIILSNCLDVDNYQFMEAKNIGADYFGDNKPNYYYIRNKKTGEVFQQRIIMPDYKGKKITISPGHSNFFHENGTHIELDLIELKQAFRENRLSGKLKELVTTLNEFDDNNVFMFINFK